ncbi:MAG: hypothetical protein KC656_28400 [Myxococcales bacterium]|nr:hypothetical protein [Myxococcales bacterium]MCB9669488.1 hypothetical protein [Alphaproteobacteria bacterium]MCB9692129.1 hypothetical protein [Alphaproteobacteria bacterium]
MLLLPAFATASEIQVAATRPVVVAIDHMPTGIAGTTIDTRDLEPGDHLVEVRSFMGATLAEMRIEVGEAERVRLAWDRITRTLYELERLPLTSSSEPPTPASALPPAEGRAHRPTGSLAVTGLSDISGHASVQGHDLAFDSDAQAWLATGLQPPVVELHLADNGTLRFHGAVDVTPGGHRTCQLLFRETAWTVTCRDDGPERR